MFTEMPTEFEPLRFAAGKSIQRLTEPEVAEPDFLEHSERIAKRLRFADLREKLDRFADRQLEHVVNRFAVQLDPQNVRLKAAAFAFRATHDKDRSGIASRSSRSRCRSNVRSGRCRS